MTLALALCWIAVLRSGFLIFRQKHKPDFDALPGLIGAHMKLGALWAVLLVVAGLLMGVTGKSMNLEGRLGLLSALVLMLSLPAVLWTGYGLKTGKPRGAFVHVSFTLLATGAGLVLASKHLWNLLF